MPRVRIPLVGSLTNRSPNAGNNDPTDQRFVNGFPEVTRNPVTGNSEVILNKRIGSIVSSDVQASATGSFASINWTTGTSAPTVFSFLKSTGTSVMFFDQSAAQVGGDVASADNCFFIHETLISGTPHLTAATEATGAGSPIQHHYYPQGGAWTQITDANFPTALPSHAHMDGYMVVMKSNGVLQHSAQNSVSSWPASNLIPTVSGGTGQGCVNYRNFIVGFTDYGTEFFANAGNPFGSVFKRVPEGVLRLGAVNLSSINKQPPFKVVGDSIYLVGRNTDSGAPGIFKITGNQFTKISNPAVDRITESNGITSIFGAFTMFGKTHIAFSSGTGDYTVLCYCEDMKFWWFLSLADGASYFVTSIIGNMTSAAKAKTYLISGSNAKIFTFDPSVPVYTDNSLAYTMTARTGNMDLGTRAMKFWESLAVIADDQASTSNIGVSHSDDDGATFSTERNIDTSMFPSVKLVRLGASRRRQWKLTHSAATACRIYGLEIEYSQGGH